MAGATASAPATGTTFAVVASIDAPIDGLSLADLNRIFMFLRTTWGTGRSINVMLPSSKLPGRRFILQRICRVSDDAYHRHVLARIFQGVLVRAPKVFDSDHEALNYVRSFSGMIAIVDAAEVGDLSVKILRVGGRLPHEPGYSLAD